MTQPAITRQIASLERELGTRLFDRTGRTVRPTAAGEALLPRARRALELVREAREAVAAVAAGSGGRLALGASSSLATYLLPPLLARFRAERPGVEIHVRTGAASHVCQLVRAGDVDVGLVTTDGPDLSRDNALIGDVLGVYETCLVVPAGHVLAARAAAPPGALAGEALLLMEPGTNLRTFADRWLAAAGVAAPVTMELDSVETIKRMIESGLGVSLLPRLAVAAEVDAGRLAALSLTPSPGPSRQIALVRGRNRSPSNAVARFVEIVGELALS